MDVLIQAHLCTQVNFLVLVCVRCWDKRVPPKPKKEKILNKQVCVNEPKVNKDGVEKRLPGVG